MSTDAMKINRLPELTWNWLHLNYTETEKPGALITHPVCIEKTESVRQSVVRAEDLLDIPSGSGTELEAALDESCTDFLSFSVPASSSDEGALVRLWFSYGACSRDVNRICLEAGEGSFLLAIMDIGAPGAQGKAYLQTKVRALKGARVTLVQLLHMDAGFEFFDDIGACCADDASFRLIQVIIGNAQTYMGVNTLLSGRRSSLAADMGYIVGRDALLDMNLLADHRGRRSLSQINSSGVLGGSAKKLFRGTIDFKNGCAGAKGDEREDVLLLSEGVVNKTVPLILCQEEDVEGGHGASIGKIDEELLFYMESRGINEEEACRMVARGRVESVIKLIPDETARLAAAGYLDNGGDLNDGQ